MLVKLTMSLLILQGVVDSMVLGWNFLTQVGAEIKCAGHEILIPATEPMDSSRKSYW